MLFTEKPLFRKVLIANRGEIALRVIRACHELGIQTVAVHSTADEEAMHVKLASQSICIGPALAKESYLNIASIISAAVATGADAIHPGYGFLSENSGFAEICGSCGIQFIGPSVSNMRAMGDKARARQVADKVGVPTIPGDSTGFLDPLKAVVVANEIGYPVLLKACAGGGGRGMKIVNDQQSFISAFETGQREVEAAFGDGHILVEKYLPRVRHVEVQIAADRLGNVIHLGVRDCSMQRRYQKIIEESPSPGLPPEVEAGLQDSAVKLAKAVNYSNVGTMEFLVDIENYKYYFIEMNTRLQVEHPVTELATGVDLVKEQIRLAAGLELSIKQEQVKVKGHTIEVRVNAEHARTQIPSPGKIVSYHMPGGNGVRVDSALYSGYVVQPYYDSLISKLIVHCDTRESAIKKALVALNEYVIDGIHTNIDLLRRLLMHPDFIQGKHHTKFLDSIDVFADKE
jgi:acetyl-CoA carboxylase biotin carboxylase subunit